MDKDTKLPQDYRQTAKYELLSSRKDILIVNGLTIFLFLFMCVIGVLLLIGKRPLPVLELSAGKYLGWMFAVLFFILAYVALHMWIHGRMMRYFSGEKPFYGIRSLYLYAGCNAFFSRREYLIILLAPFVSAGILLLLLTRMLSPIWSPAAYIIQIFNVSVSGRDLAAAYYIRKQSDDILIQDTGLSVTVYSASSGFPV